MVLLVAFGVIYATPNLYQAEPGVQVIGVRNTVIDEQVLGRVSRVLEQKEIEIKAIQLDSGKIKVRLNSEGDQNSARDILKETLGNSYGVALADMPTTPNWLANLGAEPMFLGLDLRGGVHLLYQVDMQAAQNKVEENYEDDLRKLFQENKIRYLSVKRSLDGVTEVKFKSAELRDEGLSKLEENLPDLLATTLERADRFYISARLAEKKIVEIRKAALKKNMVAIRSRIDQLGVSEPIIQQQGNDRIVVQLPGVKDPNEAIRIIGKTATLEVRLVDEKNALASSVNGRVPVGSKRYFFRDGRPILLKKRLILSGDNIVDASSGFDPQSGGPTVNLKLDAKGGSIWMKVTGQNINKRMAVVYVEETRKTSQNADKSERNNPKSHRRSDYRTRNSRPTGKEFSDIRPTQCERITGTCVIVAGRFFSCTYLHCRRAHYWAQFRPG